MYPRNKLSRKYILVFIGIAILLIIIIADLIEIFAPIESEDVSINRHSLYVHFNEEWQSHPYNILFEITTVWEKQNSILDIDDEYTEFAVENFDGYGTNKIGEIHGKSFVSLIHNNNQCVYNWKPIHYRQSFDTIQQNIEYATGAQMSSDPYKIEFPNLKNHAYSDSKQKSMIEDGFAHFVPICTSKNLTSFDYSIRIDDESIGINAYFIPSINEFNNYKNGKNFSFYPGCYIENIQSYTGTCDNITKESGLLVIIPDDIKRPVSKIMINLNEN